MNGSAILSFRDGVSLAETRGTSALATPWGHVPVGRTITAGIRAVIDVLSSCGATEDRLGQLVFEADGTSALPLFYYHLTRWRQRGLVCHTIAGRDGPVATVVPIYGSFPLQAKTVEPGTRLRLSRFAYCRREKESLVIESPLSPARTILQDRRGAALIAQLAQAHTVADVCRVTNDLPADSTETFLNLLWTVNLVTESAEDGGLVEDSNQTLVQWEFHDLLFHWSSRQGLHDRAFGGTYRFRDAIPPLRALKSKVADDVLLLFKPDLARLEPDDVSFTGVLEKRKSIRAYGDPISAVQLGEFLYRAARVRLIVPADPARDRLYETSSRPYPSGGATYDLELYLTINTSNGIRPGIYHYDPERHVLERVAERTDYSDALLAMAKLSAGLQGEPQVLITLASRFQRVSWKYASMAYATTLKNVGVLYQTMYLVATAMGLAPCALGGGNSALFAEAVGTDYLAESSVGEFLLGTVPNAGT